MNRPAFNIAVLFWLVCGALLSAIALTVDEDERTVQEHVKNCLTTASSQGGGSFSPLPQHDEETSFGVVNPLQIEPYQDENIGDERKEYRP